MKTLKLTGKHAKGKNGQYKTKTVSKAMVRDLRAKVLKLQKLFPGIGEIDEKSIYSTVPAAAYSFGVMPKLSYLGCEIENMHEFALDMLTRKFGSKFFNEEKTSSAKHLWEHDEKRTNSLHGLSNRQSGNMIVVPMQLGASCAALEFTNAQSRRLVTIEYHFGIFEVAFEILLNFRMISQHSGLFIYCPAESCSERDKGKRKRRTPCFFVDQIKRNDKLFFGSYLEKDVYNHSDSASGFVMED